MKNGTCNLRFNEVDSAINSFSLLGAAAVETLQRNLYCENPALEMKTSQVIIDGRLNGLAKLKELKKAQDLVSWD